jgi:hypothetical protein
VQFPSGVLHGNWLLKTICTTTADVEWRWFELTVELRQWCSWRCSFDFANEVLFASAECLLSSKELTFTPFESFL